MPACKNCGANVIDKFCPKCGQKSDIHRFTVKSILHNFFHAFTHVDSGILFLMKELTLRPGNTARDYIEGRRKKYFNPFQYYVLTTAVVVFLTIKFDLGTLMIADIKYTGDFEEFRRQFITFLYQYFNILQFLTLPLLSLFTYLFFKRSGYNYAENLVLNTFISAQRHLVFIIFTPFMYFYPQSSPALSRWYLFIWTVYFTWAYIQFFKPKSKIWAVVKSLVVSFLFFMGNGLVSLLIFLTFFYKGDT